MIIIKFKKINLIKKHFIILAQTNELPMKDANTTGQNSQIVASSVNLTWNLETDSII